MAEDPLKPIENLDAELFKNARQLGQFALAEGGALPRKIKLLIALALDADHGTAAGVATLARMALAAGATRQEIAEALRVALYIGGVGTTFTAAEALKNLP
jgi:alkylhydroperoxidase/carboxymuconolactone decarboxylase family protein YurZ